MSAENIEILKRAFAAWNETQDLDRVAADWAEDVEFQISSQMGRDAADFRSARGIDEAKALARDFLGSFESLRWEVDEYIDAGDHVIVLLEGFGRVAGSSTEVPTNPFAYVYTFREGKVVRIEDFPDRADALAAFGVRRRPYI